MRKKLILLMLVITILVLTMAVAMGPALACDGQPGTCPCPTC